MRSSMSTTCFVGRLTQGRKQGLGFAHATMLPERRQREHPLTGPLLLSDACLDGGQRTGPQPVAFYAAVRFLVNSTYVALIWDLIGRLGICICS